MELSTILGPPYRTRYEEAYTPSKVERAYKLFRVNKKYPGKLFPLFVDSNTPVPFDTWVDAELIPPDPASGKIKSKLGALAYRPGWHSGDIPVATHIGLKGAGNKNDVKPTHRNPDYLWAEIQVPADVDWQDIANKRATIGKNGMPVARTAHITDQLPKGGFYRYKTNPNMTGQWLISGEMKVVRVLSQEEVEALNHQHGIHDLPRLEPLDLSQWGFGTDGKPMGR